jgi:alkanesulfonate monooxygenase SsuD/methylene tetrahydromethanopterin reductase-like flavin-dependent oxidoreductase (luciferase family)
MLFLRINDGSRPMRIGVSPYGSDRGAALAFADAAIAGGIDSLWLGDGLFRRPDFEDWRGGLEALIELAWLAGRHPDVRIGITAAVLPIRDIDWLVRQAATLDVITEGRFVLAVAPGFWADELTYRRIDPDRRGGAFRERLAQLREGLGGDLLSPIPFTAGGPPIWLAGAAPTMRLAAALGLPYQASRSLPAVVAPLCHVWRSLGGGLFAHRIYVEVGEAVPDGVEVERHVLAGSPDHLLAGLRAYQSLGVDDLSLVLGHDDRSAERTLDALVREVLPSLDGTDTSGET